MTESKLESNLGLTFWIMQKTTSSEFFVMILIFEAKQSQVTRSFETKFI